MIMEEIKIKIDKSVKVITSKVKVTTINTQKADGLMLYY